ncbi:hypothetical protein I593_02308 [Acinetobacter tandoii DSM 14970 = CIP 107469]|uniref:KilA-N domain-containing protein n=1 Tax=Acinetobacter tandoii DSM 14970 = CIP 107469 TaxID=1120927 RepID=R9B219_9GAMM|nr:KilA-N domain-containing protein [Acinetobacter tandoii]EOR06441.1 hypothetical protein I593_02308 [Acinetobacter tandoii DSM 14970 = CIP 107469]
MSNLTQNFLNPNNQPLVIGEFTIRQDDEGRYCLNDFHKASGGLDKHSPFRFMRIEQTKELIEEIEKYTQTPEMVLGENSQTSNMRSAAKVIHGGNNRGTYVVKELVYSYAMWISAKFHLMVIRAYDSLVMQWKINDRQSISPEQCGILYNIVHTRAGGNQSLIKQMWSRLKNHFKYSASYRELRAIHFEDAKHYLEVMDLKGNTGKHESKTPSSSNRLEDLAYNVSMNMLWASGWWLCYRDAIQLLNPQMFSEIEDRFKSGSTYACLILGGEKSKETNARIAGVFPFNVPVRDRCALLRYK